ncbi:MAG: DUF4258 domain-containing protein [Acidobacteria bacterium]|jgi:hypothetical protein|nr:DUF4258 domain-containing protein [Acidobacteriota bacterium]
MKIEALREALHNGLVHVTGHADEEANADGLSLDEIYASLRSGEIVEDYPADSPYPSCLVSGASPQGDPVHSVWAYNRHTGFAVLITVYRPDPGRWYDDYRTRR